MAINQLKLVGKSSGDIFLLRYPNTLLDFCGFDFSSFAKGAIDLCNEALKSGNPDYDRISALRRDIQSAHCYIENNIRTIYDKIVFDCWIDYVCRRDNIGESGLWNRLVRCKTPFDKAIFARLCEFRYNRASNEWLNIIRVQDYAKSKMEFVFSKDLDSVEEAAARRNYFDMMFSVTAREMGCRIEDLGVTKVFSIGRVPPVPFMFPNVSKEIVRHVLVNFDYSDDYSEIGDYSESDDRIAMDAFSRMKAGLPKDLAGYKISNGISDKHNGRIYMPCSLKAAVDLEFDAIINDGAWLARCKRCKRFFLRSKDHPEEYCSRSMPGEKSCLQYYEDEHPRPTITPELEERCRSVTDEVYSRVDKTMSVKEYDSWHLYLEAMIAKVKNGEIPSSELENFLDYSLEVDISKSRPIVEVAKHEPESAPRERVVKPFVPERISRSEISAPAESRYEEPETVIQPPKEGFFTSPSVQRQKSERPQISHIIRNGESRGDGYKSKPDPAGFTPLIQPVQPSQSMQQAKPSRPVQGMRAAELPQFDANDRVEIPVQPERRSAEPRQFSAYEKLNLLEERIGEENRIRREMAERSRLGKQGFQPFAESVEPVETVKPYRDEEVERVKPSRSERAGSESLRGERDGAEPRREEHTGLEPLHGERSKYEPRGGEHSGYETIREERSEYEPRREESPVGADKAPEDTTPKTRVIRKNAAAISAYGKMSGAAFTTADPMERKVPESDPFKDIGSIFDILEQSEVGDDTLNGGYSDYEKYFEDYEENTNTRRDSREEKGDSSIKRVYDTRGARGDYPEERVYDPKAVARTDGYSAERGYGSREERDGPEEVRVYEPRGARDNSDGVRAYDPRAARDGEAPEDRADSRTARDDGPEASVIPEHVTRDNVPSGIWTEERNLFPRDDSANSEPPHDDSAKEKRHKSTKTQRLFDVIMREPDNNPNFRKK